MNCQRAFVMTRKPLTLQFSMLAALVVLTGCEDQLPPPPPPEALTQPAADLPPLEPPVVEEATGPHGGELYRLDEGPGWVEWLPEKGEAFILNERQELAENVRNVTVLARESTGPTVVRALPCDPDNPTGGCFVISDRSGQDRSNWLVLRFRIGNTPARVAVGPKPAPEQASPPRRPETIRQSF